MITNFEIQHIINLNQSYYYQQQKKMIVHGEMGGDEVECGPALRVENGKEWDKWPNVFRIYY